MISATTAALIMTSSSRIEIRLHGDVRMLGHVALATYDVVSAGSLGYFRMMMPTDHDKYEVIVFN